MDARLTPNDFLFPPGRPEQFRWTRKAREELGPRFARRGIRLDDPRTSEDIEDAIAKVIVFEYNVLAPEQRTDSALVQEDLRLAVRRLSPARFSTATAGGAPCKAAPSDAVGSRFACRRPPAASRRRSSGGAWRDLASFQAAMDGAMIHPGPPGGRPASRRSPAAAARGCGDLLPSRMDRRRAAPG